MGEQCLSHHVYFTVSGSENETGLDWERNAEKEQGLWFILI